MLDNDEIKLLIRVAQKVAKAKVKLGIIAEKHPLQFIEVRDSLNEIVDEISNFCNCSPIRLVYGDVEDIKNRLTSPVKN